MKRKPKQPHKGAIAAVKLSILRQKKEKGLITEEEYLKAKVKLK